MTKTALMQHSIPWGRPTKIPARLLERTRELHNILENLHEMVSNGEESTQE